MNKTASVRAFRWLSNCSDVKNTRDPLDKMYQYALVG